MQPCIPAFRRDSQAFKAAHEVLVAEGALKVKPGGTTK